MHSSDRTCDRETSGDKPYTEREARQGGLYRLQDVLPELLAQYGIEAHAVDAPRAVYCDTDAAMTTTPVAVAC